MSHPKNFLGGLPFDLKEWVPLRLRSPSRFQIADQAGGPGHPPDVGWIVLSGFSFRFVPAHPPNRVPVGVPQPVKIRLPSASRISIAEDPVNSLPLAPSFKAILAFCDPVKTPFAS